MIVNEPKNCSKPERFLEELLDYMFPRINIFRNHRPNWLKNYRTNRNLEVDFLIANPVRVCIEYQGYQHFKETKYSNLDYQQYKDDLKRILSRRKKVAFMEIFEEEYNKMKRLSKRDAGSFLYKLAKIRLSNVQFRRFSKHYILQKEVEVKLYKNSSRYLNEMRSRFLYDIGVENYA